MSSRVVAYTKTSVLTVWTAQSTTSAYSSHCTTANVHASSKNQLQDCNNQQQATNVICRIDNTLQDFTFAGKTPEYRHRRAQSQCSKLIVNTCGMDRFGDSSNMDSVTVFVLRPLAGHHSSQRLTRQHRLIFFFFKINRINCSLDVHSLHQLV